MTNRDQDLIERLKEAAAKATPGPWQVLTEEHPWTLPAKPEWDRPEAKSGTHVERRIYTQWHHPQLKGPYPVTELSIGITTEPGQSVHMVRISAENADYIALCSPDNILSLIARLATTQSELDEAREVLGRLESYVALRCFDRHLPDGMEKSFELSNLLDAARAATRTAGGDDAQ